MSALEGIKMDQGYLGIGEGQDRAVNRLWLAGMAMQALVGLNLADVHTIARQAYAMADAMLEADGQ
jgi:hypothetical protein